MQQEFFETLSHDLEQFLYLHDISAIRTTKDSFGMTVWVYEKTPMLDRVVAEFREIVARRHGKRRK